MTFSSTAPANTLATRVAMYPALVCNVSQSPLQMNRQLDRLTIWKINRLAKRQNPSQIYKNAYKNRMRPWKKWWWENPPKSPWQCLCLTAYKEVDFQGIDIKLVTVWKILKRSFKWDQSGISSLICSKVMSKTSEIKRKEEKFNDLENCPKSP